MEKQKKIKREIRVGILDIPKGYDLYPKAYSCWKGMFQRCYINRSGQWSGYKDVQVCEEWVRFSNFLPWYNENYQEGKQLDKDLLGDGKLYSPETCLFVSLKFNSFLTRHKGTGVTQRSDKSKFLARISMGKGKFHRLGSFLTREDAQLAFNEAKILEALEVFHNEGLPENLLDKFLGIVMKNCEQENFKRY